MEQFTRKCEWCESEFITPWETKTYCSREHKERARQHRKRGRKTQVEKTLHIRICKGCTHPFTSNIPHKVYCSEDCREWNKRQMMRAKDEEWKNTKTKGFKARLYFRDSGICQICMKPIDTSIKYPDLMSLSLDHIIPRSQGGTHNMDNVRIAHFICNSNRSDKPA